MKKRAAAILLIFCLLIPAFSQAVGKMPSVSFVGYQLKKPAGAKIPQIVKYIRGKDLRVKIGKCSWARDGIIQTEEGKGDLVSSIEITHPEKGAELIIPGFYLARQDSNIIEVSLYDKNGKGGLAFYQIDQKTRAPRVPSGIGIRYTAVEGQNYARVPDAEDVEYIAVQMKYKNYSPRVCVYGPSGSKNKYAGLGYLTDTFYMLVNDAIFPIESMENYTDQNKNVILISVRRNGVWSQWSKQLTYSVV